MTLLALEFSPLLAADAIEWQTGRAFEQQLASAVSVEWSGVVLRDALDGLRRAQRVAIVLDRRVDPDQLVKFQAQQLPLETVLDQLCETLQLGRSRLGDVVYLGPRSVARDLRTLGALARDEIAKLPVTARSTLLKSASWQWKTLARPRELLAGLMVEAKLDSPGIDEQLPHDLWSSVELPPLAWCDRALLVAVQYDRQLQFSSDGKSCTLAPLPSQATIEKRYPAGSDPPVRAEQYRTRAPEAEVSIAGNQIVVRGRIEDHELIAPPPNTKPPAKSTPNTKPAVEVYSLTLTEVPLEQLMSALEKRLGVKFEVDRAALAAQGVKLDQRVSLKVEQQPLDELLRATFEPVGLQFQRQDKVVKIEPKSK